MEVHPQAGRPPTVDPYAPPESDVSPPRASASGLVESVQNGTRYYLIPYVISVFILTFRRNMGQIHVVRDGEWPVGKIAASALLTGVLGWWGLPWGILYSIPTLIRLWGGGRDITGELLKESVGAGEAKRILASSPKPVKPPVFWLARVIVMIALSPPALVLYLIVRAAIEA